MGGRLSRAPFVAAACPHARASVRTGIGFAVAAIKDAMTGVMLKIRNRRRHRRPMFDEVK